MKSIKIVVEKHPDCYIAYPLGVKGAVVGEGDTYEAAVADVRSALRCYPAGDVWVGRARGRSVHP